MNSRDIQYFETIGEYCDEIAASVERFGADLKKFCVKQVDKNSHLLTDIDIDLIDSFTKSSD